MIKENLWVRISNTKLSFIPALLLLLIVSGSIISIIYGVSDLQKSILHAGFIASPFILCFFIAFKAFEQIGQKRNLKLKNACQDTDNENNDRSDRELPYPHV